MPNPFFVSGPVPPQLFVGRTSDVLDAFDHILNSGHIAIWGGSGMGKSSFLEYLSSPQAWQCHKYDPTSIIFVSLNCAVTINPFMPNQFWREVLSRLQEKLDDSPVMQDKIGTLLKKAEVGKDDFSQAVKDVGKQNKRLVLLIDEYDTVFLPHERYTQADIEVFLSQTRHLAVEIKNLSIVVASRRELNEIGPKPLPGQSPWDNHYLYLHLKPLTENDVITLLKPLPITLPLREGIREIADGHPALIQHAGFLLHSKLRDGQRFDLGLNLETFANEFFTRTRNFLKNSWELCNDEEETLLMLLALLGLKGRLHSQCYHLDDLATLFSRKERAMIYLEERGILKNTVLDGKKQYTFASSLTERWVIQELQDSDEETLQERQKVWFGLMSRRQSEQVTVAIRWLWQNRDKVPSILKWFGKVVAAIPSGAIE